MKTFSLIQNSARVILAVLALIMAGGCAHRAHQTMAHQDAAARVNASPNTVFKSAEYGFQIHYPSALELRRDFHNSYLLGNGWKAYAGPHAPPGRAIAALVMPSSNNVTTGALRIGVSRNAKSLRTCMHTPAATIRGSVDETMIDGVVFTTFKARDAGMSHYLIVRGYRAVHDGTCYALDVLVYGTNPHVYDPPRTPPFSQKQAFAQLGPIVTNLQFTTTAESR